ncbi:MAG TPA: hypothetical protein VMZ03_04125 [Chitinophagaceae bacterium]|nr:hypothetical protein [Chitinophagaceae bacterium]
MKQLFLIGLSFVCLNSTAQPEGTRETKPKKPTVVASTAPSKVKYEIMLANIHTKKSWDGGSDYTEELYGAISVCLAAAGYPPTVQLDYTYKNPVDKEINGGVEPSPQSTNPNGRVLWRQSDGSGDRRIALNSRTKDITLNMHGIYTLAVFIFDVRKDPQAAFRFFADMWESDPSDDDEHFNAGRRRVSVPISDIKVGDRPYIFQIEIWDSSSRHYAQIEIKATAVE